MAADNHNHDAPAMDYAEHEKTFSLFAGLIKWGTVFSVIFVLLTGSFTGLLPWAFTLIVSVLTTAIVAKFF
ncbi:MAG: aa3-type cytochrome c oxidase subunit IV [Rhizobiales bacterium]|nr:aa3-type cytochrome c oxidase subunit IV [Hyphomicrobiales bacterium]